MRNRRFAAPAFLAAAALTVLAVLTTVVWFNGEDSATVCGSTPFVKVAPDVDGLAFGPDVRTEITDFDKLSQEQQVDKVVVHQAETWCKYPAIALANAMHRGLVPWPNSSDEWLVHLKVLLEDQGEHNKLVEKLISWEDDQVQKYEILYIEKKYNSDWFDRSSGDPILISGRGHDTVSGWVIRRTLKDGTTLDERLVCMYQLAGPVPPIKRTPTTTTTIPSTTTTVPEKGKDASKRPTQNSVVNCPPGQFADRYTGTCTSFSSTTTTTVYNNGGGNSGPGAPGLGVKTPTTDPAPDPTVPTNTGPGDGSIPDPGV